MRYFDDGIEGDLLNNYKHDFISEFIRLGMKNDVVVLVMG